MMGENNEMGARRRGGYWLKVGLPGMVCVLIILAAALNFQLISDIVIGMRYRPSAEMEGIRSALELTDTGRRIFNATMPELLESTEFNANCREEENETAILGCFRDDRIFVYDITEEELSGIRELTSAHELLHAVYKRMAEGERREWAEVLTAVYEENKEILEKEIEIYTEEQREEELYVRAGTEISDLPSDLEQHYGEIFKDQDKIVQFYESYIKVFREIEGKLTKLETQAGEMMKEIDVKMAEYEARAEKLNTEVSEFNACAGTANCFSTNSEFQARRAELLREQEELETLYTEINKMIDKYNKIVTEYNENVLHEKILNEKINSSEKVEDL